jgi:hypothetical protein
MQNFRPRLAPTTYSLGDLLVTSRPGRLSLVGFDGFHQRLKRWKVSLDTHGLLPWASRSAAVKVIRFLGFVSFCIIVKLHHIDAVQPVFNELALLWR